VGRGRQGNSHLGLRSGSCHLTERSGPARWRPRGWCQFAGASEHKMRGLLAHTLPTLVVVIRCASPSGRTAAAERVGAGAPTRPPGLWVRQWRSWAGVVWENMTPAVPPHLEQDSPFATGRQRTQVGVERRERVPIRGKPNALAPPLIGCGGHPCGIHLPPRPPCQGSGGRTGPTARPRRRSPGTAAQGGAQAACHHPGPRHPPAVVVTPP